VFVQAVPPRTHAQGRSVGAADNINGLLYVLLTTPNGLRGMPRDGAYGDEASETDDEDDEEVLACAYRFARGRLVARHLSLQIGLQERIYI
jgi:hypothetical protein